MTINDNFFTNYNKYDSFLKIDTFDKISDNDKNKFIIKLFNDFYNYLDSIDININPNIGVFIVDKYLHHIKSGKTNDEFDIIINKLIINNITKKYFEKILEVYAKIKHTNLLINHYCLFFIYKIILLIFSYYYYIYYIYETYKKNKKVKFEKTYYLIIINDFIEKFTENKRIDETNNLKIYNIISIKLDNIINKFPHYKKNIYCSIILKYIDLMQQIYRLPTSNNYKNEYITIPQYMGNCWYISMLTAFCYSDLSKKLILSKIGNDVMKNKLISSTPHKSNKLFIETIDYIIKNITINYKKYGDEIKDNCINFTYLKEHIMDYIFLKYYELKKNKELKNTINKYKGTNIFYYKALNDKMLINPNKKEINKNKLLTTDIVKKYNIKVGADITYGFFIINSLYNIFNITTLYLYDFIHSSNYYRQNNIEYEPEKTINSPDIIFIHKKEFKPYGNYTELNKKTIIKVDKDIIIYNNSKYKLDFILHSTDTNNTCESCGHCISGIHYNGTQYYHDSSFTTLNIKCDNTNIEIPCPFIQKKWINDIYNADQYLINKNYEQQENICLFSMQKCFHKLTNMNAQNLNKNIIMEDKLCFNNLFNLIYGYVKITDEEPKEPKKKSKQEPKKKSKEPKKKSKQEPKEPKEPKKKSKQEPKEKPKQEPKEPKKKTKQELKYKSTGVKVDIINNGKVIKRIIYLGNDDNKYVKLNKEYELLSNLIKEEQKEIKKKSKKEIKYKSTGVKVDIINNKKVIKRIIYLGNDNNKYVKLNKEYELLSNLINKDI
jgi:hypothetical protein